MLGYWSPDHSRDAYARPRDAMEAIARVLKREVQQLAEIGCERIQFDAPGELTMAVEHGWSSYYEDAGYTKETFLVTATDFLSDLASVPGISFSVPLCRGNLQNEWHSSGGYEAIGRQVFPRLTDFDYILLEYDDERSGGFEPLVEIPEDSCVVLGLVSTKNPTVESVAAVARRVHEASQFHPLERLAVSPQCGFASVLWGNLITPEVEQAKLRVVADAMCSGAGKSGFVTASCGWRPDCASAVCAVAAKRRRRRRHRLRGTGRGHHA